MSELTTDDLRVLRRMIPDKTSGTPLYLQLVQAVNSMIDDGTLRPGDKLPAERELAARYKVARGTINKAYDILEQSGVIRASQGMGSFVAGRETHMPPPDKDEAIGKMDALIHWLQEMKYSTHEIRTIFNLRIMALAPDPHVVRVAAVDCNPEALSVFSKQLEYMKNVHLSQILLDDLRQWRSPQEILEGYDLLFTTPTHFREIRNILRHDDNRVVQAAVNPDQATVITLATLNTRTPVGIISESAQFMMIVRERLNLFGFSPEQIHDALISDQEGVTEVMNRCQRMIIPSEVSQECESAMAWITENYEGQMIRFEYQMDRGSLIYMEDRISEILRRKEHDQ